MQKENICITAWMDKKTVSVISTNCHPTEMSVFRKKDGTQELVKCPAPIVEYNKYMRGVDHGDQLRAYHLCRSKCRKFYKYIFWFLVDVAVTNSYIFFRNYCASTLPLKNTKEFRLNLANNLIGSYNSRKRPGRAHNVCKSLSILHFPITQAHQSGTHKTKQMRCQRCKEMGCRGQTKWQCKECDVWLCHTGQMETDCFYKWHQNL